jgi:hypothetical protein
MRPEQTNELAKQLVHFPGQTSCNNQHTPVMQRQGQPPGWNEVMTKHFVANLKQSTRNISRNCSPSAASPRQTGSRTHDFLTALQILPFRDSLPVARFPTASVFPTAAAGKALRFSGSRQGQHTTEIKRRFCTHARQLQLPFITRGSTATLHRRLRKG